MSGSPTRTSLSAVAPLLGAVFAVGLAACGDNITLGPTGDAGTDAAFDWKLPPGFPLPKVPENNPMTNEKVALGRFLFYDPIISGNQTQSCGSCHSQQLGFAEPDPVSTGSTGEMTPRNSMALINVAYNSTYTWHNPMLGTLEQQILIPMFGEMPTELGLMESQLISRIEADARYPEMFAAAFPDDAAPITTMNAVKAIAAFVRTMISSNSPYDKVTYLGDESAMSESAKRGLNLFLSEIIECHHCHGGFNFSQAVTFEGQEFLENGFFNTGLYNVAGSGLYPAPNQGLIEFSGRQQDAGKFRVPTLRNIMKTAPYLHDGTAATIDDVLDIYAAGGRNVTTGPSAGDGRFNPFKSGFVHGFTITPDERNDVKALLEALTDEDFLTDPRFSNPFEQ